MTRTLIGPLFRSSRASPLRPLEIFPDRGVYVDGSNPEAASVADPLDDVAFLYHVRRQPLDVGTTVEMSRYFKPQSNPVILKVLRRDTVEAAGRKSNTVVVQPIIRTSTMFADGDGRVWISDDSSRVIVQIATRLPVGSITMRLRTIETAVVASKGRPKTPH